MWLIIFFESSYYIFMIYVFFFYLGVNYINSILIRVYVNKIIIDYFNYFRTYCNLIKCVECDYRLYLEFKYFKFFFKFYILNLSV